VRTIANQLPVTTSEKIRVFHLCDKFGIRGALTHGVSRLFTWWLPRFDTRFEVRLVGLRPHDESSAYLRRQGLDPICLGRGPFDPAVATDLLRLVRRDRPHILHSHGYASSNFARVVGALTGVRTIVHEHAAYPSIPGYQRSIDWLLAGRTDLGIAVSESTKAFMVSRRCLPPDRIRVVFNGAPLEEFRLPSADRVEAERARLGLRRGEPVIGTVGRLDAQKGITYFLRAAALVLRHRPDVRFVIAGDGHLLAQHQEEARVLGIADRTVFAGFCEDVPLVQSVLDVQVFASLWEGTPLTVFEAMAMRRPIVSTTVDGLGEVLRHGENALLVPPRDVEGLATGVLELLERPALAARLAAQAGTDSCRFDVRRTVEQLQELYEGLVNGRR
jgi:glycosyltransferase involved in cell wall biosynthesis